MSLDKFVSRGFTSSTGGGLHSWVAKAPQSHAHSHSTARDAGSSGTSFVLGSGRSNRTQSSQTKEAFGGGLREEIRSHGTRGKGPIPSQCFGGGQKNDDSSALGAKVIPAAFLFAVFLGAAYVFIHAMGLIPKPHPIEHKVTTDADVYKRRQAYW